jgi:hypothetical protein
MHRVRGLLSRALLRIRHMFALAPLLLAALPLGAQTAGTPTGTLPGHVVQALARATRVPHTAQMDEEPITITVMLNLSDPAGASALEQAFVDPNSAKYRKTITVNEFTSRFGPSQESWDAVLAYLEAKGFVLSYQSRSRRTMGLRGTRAQAQKAFNVTIDDYVLGNRAFHAIADNPAVPASIAPMIARIGGLTNLAQWHPSNAPSPATPMSYATAYNGTLTPAGSTNTAGLPPGLDGSGQYIGLLEFDGFQISDVTHWLSFVGLPKKLADQVTTIQIAGGTAPSGCSPTAPQCGTTEVLLDIEAAIGIAQGADVRVYTAPQGTDIGLAMDFAGSDLFDVSEYPSGPGGAVLSISWAQCEGDISSSDATSIDGLASELMMFGITIFASSGDTGSTCTDPSGQYPNTIQAPANAPHVIAVGGTILDVNSDNSYHSESWWKNAGGYGVSQASAGYFPEPSFQSKAYPGATGRSIPDVAMEAGDGITICYATPSSSPGCEYNFVGTSLSTPLMAATWAIAGQAVVDAGGIVYSAADGYFYEGIFKDGFHAASTMTGPGNNFHHLGLGSPEITNLIAIAVPPQIDSVSPASGAAEGGTKVTVHGAGFIGVQKVKFGTADGTHLTIKSDTELSIESPEATSQEAPIEVQTPGGHATAGPFHYTPEITEVKPHSGPMEGGASVTVTGRALDSSETFVFGSVKATKVSCSSSTTCAMITPANNPGSAAVQAQTSSGLRSPITSASHYHYDMLEIDSFTPSVGPTTGGLMIQVYGHSFENKATTFSFGGLDATDVFCPDPEYCYMMSPSSPTTGTVPVTATIRSTTSAPAPQRFTFEVFPRVTGISPNKGNPGVVVTLTGTGFSTTPGQTTFSFFGVPVTGICTSTTQCTAVVDVSLMDPSGAATEVTVTVNGNTSLDSVGFSYSGKPIPPPCHGTTCT